MKEERGDGVNDMKNRRKGQEKPCGGLVYEQVAKLTSVPRPVSYTPTSYLWPIAASPHSRCQ